MKRNLYPIIIIAVILILAGGCSTQKNTFINRNYHSITTLYNGYFNARESYRQGLKHLEEAHEDNFEDVLSIFKYGSEQQAGAVASNMDIAYQKSSTAIRKHSMNIRGVEYNRYIDDAYYLIARSHYFKRDYNLAILTFQYVIRQFDTPLKYKSKIWVAKTQIQTKQFDNAQQILERVTRNIEDGLLNDDALYLYNKVYADFYLQQQNFVRAAPYLEQAVELAPGRKQRTRLAFILAQSYHFDKNYSKAQEAYARVLKMNPGFEMAFQARINMAMAFDTESGDRRFIESELKGMLRDSKNRDFQDQIYYALAQFSMRQNKVDAAIEYYNQALENYRGNDSQKGLTFLRLGQIKTDRKEYVKAAQLYDSTMTYLSSEYPEYESAGKKSLLLQELSLNLQMVEREDSLQRLAAMDASQRNQILDEIIEELAEQERLDREREQERQQMRQQMARSGRGRSPGAGGDGWYFYNTTAINYGKNEFYAKWGERELEDLWRISNKQTMAFGDMGDFDMMDDDIDPSGRVTRATLMENVPTTPEQMETSNERQVQAIYNAGLIFKDRLNDPDEASNYFERIINQFPDSEHRLYTAYFLHSIARETGNPQKAEVYKNLIISEFPDTDFARILKDPQYRHHLAERQNQGKVLYQQAYQAYKSGNYDLALGYYQQGDTLDISRDLKAQFSFLRALIYSKTDQHDQFIQQLTFVTQNYEGTQVHDPANNLLAYLGDAGTAMAQTPGGDEPVQQERHPAETLEHELFSFNENAVHFYVLLVNTKSLQIRELRNEINVFNTNEYDEENLNMSTLFFEQDKQLITVTNFPDAGKAMQYGRQMEDVMVEKDFDLEAFKGFAISVDNYPVFYQERKLDDYLEFFNAAYSGIE